MFWLKMCLSVLGFVGGGTKGSTGAGQCVRQVFQARYDLLKWNQRNSTNITEPVKAPDWTISNYTDQSQTLANLT